MNARDKDVGRFGRWADRYDESALQRVLLAPLQELVLEQAAAAQPDAGAILDVGCGTGLLLRRAAGRFPSAHLTGVDAAMDMVRVAEASVPAGASMRFVNAFAEELPFADGTFDLVLSTMSFHHWADQGRGRCEVRRVSSHGALLVLADAFPTGWLRWIVARSRHGRFSTPAVLERMLSAAGFTLIRIEPMPRWGGSVRVVLARAVGEGPQAASCGGLRLR